MDKEAVVHVYIMEYYTAVKRNAFESVLMSWMNLESIIQSEVCQKKKDKYCVLLEYCPSLVVHWVGLGAFIAQGLGSIPGRGTKSLQAM